MGNVGNLWASLKLNIADFANKLNTAQAGVNRFSMEMRRGLAGASTGFDSAANRARKLAADLNGKPVDAMDELNKSTFAWGLNLKSVSRVVSGILISQAFYTMTREIRNATNAVWEFTQALETARVAYSNLFGDASLATEFINVLKDFAAKTPFTFTEAETAAKRLLAYGIEYKNVMYVMQGVLSAASIQGDSAKIESISRALGQIYTYGKLMTQEVRQLSEAGIPAYEILREELGLTQEQLKDLGREGIPASLAINALVDGIQKRFGSAAEAASLTITGIISNIKDNSVMLFSALLDPLATFMKAALKDFGAFLYYLRDIVELKGAGGVFEALFPPEMHSILRQFIANIITLGSAFARLVAAIGGILKPMLDALLRVFNAFAPVISTVVNVLAILIDFITSNAVIMNVLSAALAAAATLFVIFKAKALATAVVTKVLMGIETALRALQMTMWMAVAHPFWAMIIGLSAILIGLSGGFGKLSESINSMFKTLTGFNGVDPDKLLLPSQKDRANDLDKFNNKLEGTSDAMDDLADSTSKANKSLLSFDEVFRLNDPDEGTDNGIETPITPELDFSDIETPYMPEVPSFSDYIDKFKAKWDEIKDKMSGIIAAAIGAAFGGAIGMLIGGAIGRNIGLLAGAVVGYFWNELANKLGLSPDQKVNAAIIGGVGAVIGAALGGIIGGPLGAKIGAAIGGFVGSFWGLFAEKLGVLPIQHIATVISGAISGLVPTIGRLFTQFISNMAMFGGWASMKDMVTLTLRTTLTSAIKGGVIGAITGLGAGILSNALTAWIAGELELADSDLENAGRGQMVGSIVGTIAGLIFGGPVGSIVGGAIGTFAGSIVGLFWDVLAEKFGLAPSQQVATSIGSAISGLFTTVFSMLPTFISNMAMFGGFASTSAIILQTVKTTIVGAVKGGVIGAITSLGTGLLANALTGWMKDELNLSSENMDDAGTGQFVGNIIGSIAGALLGGPAGSILGGAIGTFGGSIIGLLWESMSNALKGVAIGGAAGLPIGAIVGLLVGSIGGPLGAALGATVGVAIGGLVGLIVDNWGPITEFFSGVGETVMTAFSGVLSFITGIPSAVATAFSTVASVISGTLGPILQTVISVFSNILSTIGSILGNIFSVVASIFGAIFTVVKDIVTAVFTVVTDIFKAIFTVLSDIFKAVVTVFTDILNAIWTVLSTILSTVGNLLSLILGVFVKIIGAIVSFVVEKFTSMLNTVKSIFTAIFTAISSAFTNIYNFVSPIVSKLVTAVKNWFTGMVNSIKTLLNGFLTGVKNVFNAIYNFVSPLVSKLVTGVKNWFTGMVNSIKTTLNSLLTSAKTIFTNISTFITTTASGIYSSVTSAFKNVYTDIKTSISDMYDTITSGIGNIYTAFTNWVSDLWDNVFGKFFGWINDGIDKLKEFFGLESEASTSKYTDKSNSGGGSKSFGHATGGIFDREHVARFAEGDKAEAIIPLENATAMQPFVTAVSDGLTASLAPLLANISSNNSNAMQPLYVGTLIADERSLKELERKMEVIRMKENRR